MKKLIAWLLVLALALCAAAAESDFPYNPESDFTYYPESEAYVGDWYVDDYILQIDHMAEDYNQFTCVVTKYATESEGVRWIYDGCAYDDVGEALSCNEVGMKLDVLLEAGSEPVATDHVYFDDGAASFALNDNGTLTWSDAKVTPGENEIVFRKVETDVPNPVAAYEGDWAWERASLTVEDLDDVITCTVRWGGSAFETAEWVYENCMYDEATGGLTTFETGVKRIVTYGEDGEVVSSEVEYSDGAASFVINDAGKLVWTDFKETPGENEIEFEKLPPVSD